MSNCKLQLLLYVNPEYDDLVQLYTEHAEKHNQHLVSDDFPNSGFDIFIPENTVFEGVNVSKLINLQIKTEMVEVCECENPENKIKLNPQAFYVYPRSSMSKTPLMLSNHTGIIDSGYRGWLQGAFRHLPLTLSDIFTVEKHTRLLQICHPSLRPFHVSVVKDIGALSVTKRGEGGFGSTGIVGLGQL
jgi:dUTP pyrophosphatase